VAENIRLGVKLTIKGEEIKGVKEKNKNSNRMTRLDYESIKNNFKTVNWTFSDPSLN